MGFCLGLALRFFIGLDAEGTSSASSELHLRHLPPVLRYVGSLIIWLEARSVDSAGLVGWSRLFDESENLDVGSLGYVPFHEDFERVPGHFLTDPDACWGLPQYGP